MKRADERQVADVEVPWWRKPLVIPNFIKAIIAALIVTVIVLVVLSDFTHSGDVDFSERSFVGISAFLLGPLLLFGLPILAGISLIVVVVTGFAGSKSRGKTDTGGKANAGGKTSRAGRFAAVLLIAILAAISAFILIISK